MQPLERQRRIEYERARDLVASFRQLRDHLDMLALAAHGAPSTSPESSPGPARAAAGAGYHGKPHKMLTDIGAGYQMWARVDDPTTIAINVGLGLFVDMTLDEANAHVKRRLEAAERCVQHRVGRSPPVVLPSNSSAPLKQTVPLGLHFPSPSICSHVCRRVDDTLQALLTVQTDLQIARAGLRELHGSAAMTSSEA